MKKTALTFLSKKTIDHYRKCVGDLSQRKIVLNERKKLKTKGIRNFGYK